MPPRPGFLYVNLTVSIFKDGGSPCLVHVATKQLHPDRGTAVDQVSEKSLNNAVCHPKGKEYGLVALLWPILKTNDIDGGRVIIEYGKDTVEIPDLALHPAVQPSRMAATAEE
jgi:hypothetical protein